jgi:two-component system, cell cycle response regulator
VAEPTQAGGVGGRQTVADKLAILLVEDDRITRRLVARLLRRAGYEVEEATDGAEALARIQQKFFPILITDWEMPQMDGPTLCKRIRALELPGYVYSLLLTARDSKEHTIAGLEAGADDYLTKPLHEAELFARLKTGARIVALEQNLRAANERNRKLSITDVLTGAYNRRYFNEQLHREIERCRRYKHALSIAMGDIDFFKKINDGYGHSAGDEVLGQFVQIAQRSIRTTSDWIARYGGEEFVIVMPETGYFGAMQATEKVRAAISVEPLATTAGSIPITASFGVATLTPDGSDAVLPIAELIAIADARLYASKHAGRNCVTGV